MPEKPPQSPQAEPPLFQRMKGFAAQMLKAVPHAEALGLEITDIEQARAFGRAPYREELIGDPETGVIAGGVIITLLDNLGGVAVVAALDEPTTVATLDLRIDYMRPASPGRDVLATAHCYHVARSAAFVRAVAYEDSPDDPVAHASGVFMLDTKAGRKSGGNLGASKKGAAG
jgi:uncharacterized protein (TIGR00369 family)